MPKILPMRQIKCKVCKCEEALPLSLSCKCYKSESWKTHEGIEDKNVENRRSRNKSDDRRMGRGSPQNKNSFLPKRAPKALERK